MKPEHKDTDTPVIEQTLRDDAEEQPACIPKNSPGLKGLTTERLFHELQVNPNEIETITENLLTSSESRYRRFFEAVRDGILIVDAETGTILDVNPFLIELLGFNHEQFLGKKLWEIGVFKDIAASKDNFKELQEKKYIHFENLPLETADGRQIYADFVSFVYDVGDNKVMQCNIRDITERKRAGELIWLLARMSDDAPASITVHDFDGNYLYVNEETLRLHGYTREEYLAKNLHEIDVPGSKELITERMQEIHDTGEADFEVEHFRKDGTIFPLYVNAKIIDWGGKKVLMSIAIDLTERKCAELALRESYALAKSERKYRDLFESSRDAIMTLEPPSWKFTSCNQATVALFGAKSEGEFVSLGPWDVAPEFQPDGVDSVSKAKKMIKKTVIDGSASFEWVHKRIDGREFISTVLLTRMERQGTVFLQATVRDITDRKRAEEALALANKKLTLLSGITRHDINNQLTVLVGYLRILEKKQPDTIHNEYFQKIATAAQRISSMIQFTREYESIGVNAPTWQECHTLVDTAAKQAPLGMVVVKNDLPAGAEMFADSLVVKVFYNLMDNAVRYGGKITTIRFSVKESENYRLIICEDDGNGIPIGEKEKIFDRGFGKNTGLGLALSREILDITGISITETGEPGKGARFEMTVPKGMYR